jgi:hypothetical protein
MNLTALRQRQLGLAISLACAAGLAHAGATITVNSNDDDAASTFCNLRNAITSAVNGASTPNCVGQVTGAYADPDTIQFDSSLGNATITLTQGAFAVDGVAIDLVGSGKTIDAGGLSRIFSMINSSTLSLSDATLTAGHSATYGGSISVGAGSSLTLTNSTVTNSYAKGSGGAIYGATGATVTLNNSTISANSAGTNGDGGGIYAKSSTVTLTNATISGNSAGAKGGALYAFGGSLTLIGSAVSSNTATGLGGAILSSNSNTLSIDHCTLSGNTGLRAGAIYLSRGTAVITASTLSGNSANCATFCAGAIYAYASAVNVVDSTMNNNLASGAVDFQAGAAYFYNSTATFTNSTIASNSATGNNGIAGGMWELHAPTASGGLTLINSTVTANNANSLTAGNAIGGGLVLQANPGPTGYVSTLTLANAIVSANFPADSDIVIGSGTPTLSTTYSLLGAALNTSPFNDAANHNVFNDNPGLGPLQNNGGPTQTMALLPGSPALRAGSPASAVFNATLLYFDQRGSSYVRTFSGTVDIGAYEDQGDRIFASELESEP